MLIGITGQIGTGKTEVARVFERHGAYLISADQIGREVVEGSPRVLKHLADVFGPDILTPGGKLRRRRLGEIAFSSNKSKLILNNIVHPLLLKDLERRVKRARRYYDLIVIDAALLIDWGWHRKVDLSILVHAGKEIKIRRLINKGYSRHEAVMRIKAQLSFRLLRDKVDIVLMNNRDLASLERRVLFLIRQISTK